VGHCSRFFDSIVVLEVAVGDVVIIFILVRVFEEIMVEGFCYAFGETSR